MPHIAKILIAVGVLLIIAGLVVWFAGNKFSWFGNLPGDIRVEKENFRFYAPLVSMLLISIVLSVIIWLVGKLFN